MNSISAVDSLMLETTGELILSPLNFCLDIVSKFKLFCEYATDWLSKCALTGSSRPQSSPSQFRPGQKQPWKRHKPIRPIPTDPIYSRSILKERDGCDRFVMLSAGSERIWMDLKHPTWGQGEVRKLAASRMLLMLYRVLLSCKSNLMTMMLGTNDDDDNADADADDDDGDDGDDDHDDHDDVLNIYATQHVHVHWTVLCIPVNSTSWIHDLAQYKALERTQWKCSSWYSCWATGRLSVQRRDSSTEFYMLAEQWSLDDTGQGELQYTRQQSNSSWESTTRQTWPQLEETTINAQVQITTTILYRRLRNIWGMEAQDGSIPCATRLRVSTPTTNSRNIQHGGYRRPS